ncbi:MAG: methionine--tRNA ligase, partial [Clostridia bacterium]|nr:methionine--tRNA ligase [Clostridia bacterium]
NFGSSLPADIIARYFRLKKDDVCFVSGSDCFGTPTSIQAQKEGVKPQSISDHFHEKFVDVFNETDFSFNNFFKTTDKRHIAFVQDFHRDLYKSGFVTDKKISQLYCEDCHRFLPDRYVVGNCPYCKASAKGDSCDSCGKILEPEDLLEPKCSICAHTPIPRETTQKYLNLPLLKDKLYEFFNKRKGRWMLNAVNMTQRYFDEGLRERAITRNLNWGVPMPDSDDKEKVIYNWAENVLGYLSASKVYCDSAGLNFDDFWKNANAIHYYIHAKDNIPFHTLIFPALLLGNSQQFHLPDIIVSAEYVTLEGKKISKSGGTYLTVKEFVKIIDSDFLRYYFAKTINDKKDVNFSFSDFVNTVNGEVINNWGNLVNRSLSFVKSKFNGTLLQQKLSADVKENIEKTFKNVAGFYEAGKINLAVKEIMALVAFSNKQFNIYQPWITINTDEGKCRQQLFDILTLVTNTTTLLAPIITRGTKKVFNFLGTDENNFEPYYFNKEIKLSSNIAPLYKRLDLKEIEQHFKSYIPKN